MAVWDVWDAWNVWNAWDVWDVWDGKWNFSTINVIKLKYIKF